MNYRDTLIKFVKTVIITTIALVVVGLIFFSLTPEGQIPSWIKFPVIEAGMVWPSCHH